MSRGGYLLGMGITVRALASYLWVNSPRALPCVMRLSHFFGGNGCPTAEGVYDRLEWASGQCSVETARWAITPPRPRSLHHRAQN
jgi:hypothetical protein